jgi:hypothetical protein
MNAHASKSGVSTEMPTTYLEAMVALGSVLDYVLLILWYLSGLVGASDSS